MSSLTGTAQAGMVSLSLLFMIAGLRIFWKLIRQTFESKTGLAALILLSFSLLVLLHAASQTTYAAGLFASSLAGWVNRQFSHLLRQGARRRSASRMG
ncbi:MAG: hypothetical protein ACUVXB_14015, partial [Bryobacteraceae bacterium]